MAGRPPGDSADGKVRLLDACWRLLMDIEPGKKLTIAAVCSEAGCTPPTLYHHFGSLPALERAASERALERWGEQLLERYRDNDEVEARLLAIARDYVDWAVENPRAYSVMFARPGADYFPKDLNDLHQLILMPEILEDLGTLCDLDPDGPEIMQLAISHWVVIHGLASMAIASADFDRELQQATFSQITDALVEPLLVDYRQKNKETS